MAPRRSILALLTVLFLALSALAAPALVQAGGGCHGPVTAPGDGEASVIKIDGCMFFPTVARVPVGTTVRFLNTGLVPHNVTGVSGSWASGDFASGAEYRHAFTEPGVYPFACTLHPGMNGAIVVGGAVAAAPPAAAPQPDAELATSTQPQESTAGPDPASLALVGLASLGIGLAVGFAASRMRPRTTD
jgi:plastocyanin